MMMRMCKQQKLGGAAFSKLKATREREERKCAISLYVFLPKKSVAKAKCKDDDAERTSELGGEEQGENMMETNIEIKAEEKFPAGISVDKDNESDNEVPVV